MPQFFHRALGVARRLHREIVGANLPLISASVTFFGFFAIFPLLVSVVSLFGLVASVSTVEQGVQELMVAIPPDARAVVTDQFQDISSRSGAELCISTLAGAVVSVFSSAKATFALIWGVNTAYGLKETRRYVALRMLSFYLTAGAVAFVLGALALIALLPIVLPLLGLDEAQEYLLTLGRWPLLGLAYATALSVLYHFAPDRRRGKYRWFSWGALVAAAAWLVASAFMALYAAHFPNSNEVYGALGGVIALNAWLYVSILTTLLGARLNAEIEERRQRSPGPHAQGVAV